MLTLTDALILEWFEQWLWPFFRILGLLMTAPVFGTRMVPMRARVILGGVLAALIGPLAPPSADIDPLTIGGALVAAQQVVIGSALGLALRLVFLVFEISGQLMAQQMGLAFAAMVDPQTGNQVPVVSQFYVIMATLMFLALDGHLLLLESLTTSFTTMPVGGGAFSAAGLWSVFEWTGYLLGEALRLSLPVLTALLIVNVGFGVMSRAAPQLNIFVVGFPLMMLGGITAMLLVFGRFAGTFEQLMVSAFVFLDALLSPR